MHPPVTNPGSKWLSLINAAAVFAQIAVLLAYCGLVSSRATFQVISAETSAGSNRLMGSMVADILVSYPAWSVVALTYMVAAIATRRIEGLPKRAWVNAGILTFTAALYEIAARAVYTAVDSAM